MRPIAIDLFAGAGGLSLGFEQAGFDVSAAIEVDPVHCAVHKFNFPHSAVIPRSVVGLRAEEIRTVANLGGQQIECVFGGSPCQGFSLIGKRALDDPRNRLVLEFVRLVRELDSRTFVFENVKGLTVGKHKSFLLELVAAFNLVGYDVRVPWQVLDAAEFGVPQHRERLFLLGAKKGTMLPAYPSPTTNAADARRLVLGLPIGPTCEEAIGDLPDVDCFETLLTSDSLQGAPLGLPSPYVMEMRCFTESSWHSGYLREWDSNTLTSSARTIHTAISRRRFAGTKPGSVEPISRFLKLSSQGLSNTLRAGTDGARGAFTSPRPVHFTHDRCVTVREMARLHGFPDWFRFHATKWHGARQIGNAVPPPLARAVALSVLEAVPHRSYPAPFRVALGDPALLYMDMSQAAEHFGVKAPISRRDRKSGAKKRKQCEIEEAERELLPVILRET